MPPPTYLLSCPGCGQQLQPVALGPQHAPWACITCRHGYFVAELTASARAAFRPRQFDFGFGKPAQKIAIAVEAELSEALTRGTSLREDQLGLVALSVLSAMQLPKGAFAALIAAAIASRAA